MILKALKYTRFEDEPREWKIVGKADSKNNDFAEFGNINLMVGKNASGKSRTLAVIREVAGFISGRKMVQQTSYPSEKYELVLENNNQEYSYTLAFRNKQITCEKLELGNNVFIDRNAESCLINGKKTDISSYHIAISQKNENDEYYFPEAVEWGKSLKNYYFSNQIEKNRLVEDYKKPDAENNINNNLLGIYTFYKGTEKFGEAYVNEIKACMKHIGYDISSINIEKLADGYSLNVEEDGKYTISQREMSQGMYRALSLFIQLVYTVMSETTICILFDDIGEGLDYERSKSLIDILIKKINNSNIQIFMTSNDRYVMNKIPLKYWTIIDRKQSQSIFYNYFNSQEIFDDFRYTGLNNFDFLATDFYLKGFNDAE